jgi:hypothetical protein
LVFIAVALAALVAVALLVVLRQEPAAYKGDRAPDDAAHDYLLALARGESERAYGLLSPDMPGYPTSVDAFEDDVFDQGWRFDAGADAVTLRTEVESSTADRATVVVRRAVFREGGLVDSEQYGDSFRLRLTRLGDGSWRVSGGERFVHTCWTRPEECRGRSESVEPPPEP